MRTQLPKWIEIPFVAFMFTALSANLIWLIYCLAMLVCAGVSHAQFGPFSPFAPRLAAAGGADPTLLAEWLFTEGSGTSVADSSGNGHTATLTGGTAWSTLGSYGAVQFDGVDDAMTFSVASGGTTFTIEMWIYPETSSDAYGTLFLSSGAVQGLYYRGAINQLEYYNVTGVTAGGVSENAQHHVAVVVTAGSRQFYIDGVADGAPDSGVNSATFDTAGNDGVGNNFKGKVAKVQLYSVARSAGQIAADAASP